MTQVMTIQISFKLERQCEAIIEVHVSSEQRSRYGNRLGNNVKCISGHMYLFIK